jgi:predicted exporter
VKRFAPAAWLAVVLVAAIYFVVRMAGGFALESNILALLPREARNPSEQSVQDRVASAFSHRVVFLVGDPSSAKAIAAAQELTRVLTGSGMVAITSKIDSDALRRMAAAYFPFRAGLLSEGDRARLLAGDGEKLEARALSMIYGPGGFANAAIVGHDPFFLMPSFFLNLPVPQSRLAADGNTLSVRDGSRTYVLVSGDLKGDPYSLAFEDKFDAILSRTLADLKRTSPDLTILRTGAVFYSRDSATEAMNETSTIGFVSIVGTLALILLVFRGLRPILLGFMAISVGVLCAFVGTVLLFGSIHVVALLFGVSLIGVSVDYSLQYFCEYFDDDAPTPELRLGRVLPGVALGIVTTLIGYCTLLLAPFPGLRQVATFSVIGLAASVLTVLLWYPILDTKSPPSGDRRFVDLASRHWQFWELPTFHRARIAAIVTCVAAALLGLFFLRTDDDVRHLQSLSPDLKRQEAEIERLTGTTAGTQFLLVQGANDEALLETEEKLTGRLATARRNGALAGSISTAQFVPSIARQKDNRALARERLIEPYLTGYLEKIGYDGTVDLTPSNRFLVPVGLPRTGPLSLLSILDVSSPGHPAHVVLLQGVKDAPAIGAAISGIPDVQLVSLTDDWTRLFSDYRRYAIALLALSAVLMYPLLAWRYGAMRALRVLAPSLVAVALTPPLTALAGVTFTFFNAMALVLVLSVGVDYAVFCCETSGARKPVTALAIALAALSTILAFGMLAFSRVFAVHAFGMTMLVGTTLAFLFAPAAGDAASRIRGDTAS